MEYIRNMKMKIHEIIRLNELFRELSPDELPYVKNIEDYGKERIDEAISIIENYKSDRGQYLVAQLNQITVDLFKEENNMDERRRLLNNASS